MSALFEKLEAIGLDPLEYLSIAKTKAKQTGYNSDLLIFSNRKGKKLSYNGVHFGSSFNNDFIIYSHLVSMGQISKEEADKHRYSYLARASRIKGNWKMRLSANSLSMSILW